MHKVSIKFAEYADSYLEQLDPNSLIAKVVLASREGQEVPKSLILKAIDKVEDYRDQDLFYAVKDGEFNASPSKSVTQMIRLLRLSLTTTASGQTTKLHIPDNAAFNQMDFNTNT